MTIALALWCIAICEAIRLLQNTLQLIMSQKDLNARLLSNRRYIDGLNELDKMLNEIRENEDHETINHN